MMLMFRWFIVRLAAWCVGLSRFLPNAQAIREARVAEANLPAGIDFTVVIVALRCDCPKCRAARGEPVAIPEAALNPEGLPR